MLETNQSYIVREGIAEQSLKRLLVLFFLYAILFRMHKKDTVTEKEHDIALEMHFLP